jgi:hypothetical protein
MRVVPEDCADSITGVLGLSEERIMLLSTSPPDTVRHGASPQNLVNLRTYIPTLFKPISAVLCLVFALCFAAPNAHGDSFTPIFTCTGTCPAPLPTAPDMTFPASSITVTWDSNVFTLPVSTNPILENPNDIYSWLDIGILRMESRRKETEFYSSSRNRIISFHLAPHPDSVLDPGGRDSI